MKVSNPYLSVEVGKKQFRDLKKDLFKKLVSLGFKKIKVLKNPHISVAYIRGEDTLSQLKTLVKKICKHPFVMTIKGIKCIESSYFQGTIVSLSLHHSKDFVFCQRLIENFATKDEIRVRKNFPGGFQAHVSLFVLKGLTKKDKFLIEKILSEELSNINFEESIKGKTITLYNKNREMIITQQLC